MSQASPAESQSFGADLGLLHIRGMNRLQGGYLQLAGRADLQNGREVCRKDCFRTDANVFTGKGEPVMDIGMEVDQFELLEQKIDRLIGTIQSLKRENESLSEKLQIQEEKLADVNEQLENLRASRDNAKARIISLLDKIEQIGL